MSESLEIREYQRGEEEELVKLLDTVFHGWPKFDLKHGSLEHWKWKYLDNPLKRNTIAVALSGDKIIGCAHGLFVKIKIGDDILFSQQGTDSAILSDYQGKGIWSKLNTLKNEATFRKQGSLIYSVSNHPIFVKRGMKLKIVTLPQKLLSLVYIGDVNYHLKMNEERLPFIKRYMYDALKLKNRLTSIGSDRKLGISFNVVDVKIFDDRVNGFWEKFKNDYSFLIVRDLQYLNWRFCDPRGGNYLIKQAEEDGEILGYCVYRVNRYYEDYPRGYIADLVASPGRVDVAYRLLREALDHLDKLGVNVVYAWMVSGHSFCKNFNRLGFINDMSFLQIQFENLGECPDLYGKMYNGQLAYFSYADSDWI